MAKRISSPVFAAKIPPVWPKQRLRDGLRLVSLRVEG
jgi:hypothetical protein